MLSISGQACASLQLVNVKARCGRRLSCPLLDGLEVWRDEFRRQREGCTSGRVLPGQDFHSGAEPVSGVVPCSCHHFIPFESHVQRCVFDQSQPMIFASETGRCWPPYMCHKLVFLQMVVSKDPKLGDRST